MSVLGGIAAFLATSLVTIVVATTLSTGYAAATTPAPLDVVQPTSPHDLEQHLVDDRHVEVPVQGAPRAGILWTPHHAADAPGVVLVAGSGSADEHTLAAQAAALAAHGVVVLTVDKDERGYSPLSRDYAALADDAADAASWLAMQDGVDAARVGLLGFSEGGWVAPLAAHRHDGIAFVALVSSPVVTPLEQSAYAVDQAIATWPAWLRAVPATLVAGGGWVCDYVEFDLRDAVGSIDVPVFAVLGAEDSTVPVAEAATRLEQLASGAHVEIVAGAGHEVPLDDDWLARAASWMHDPTSVAHGVVGVRPEQATGLVSLPRRTWLLHPVLHLGASLAVAIAAGLGLRASARSRSRHEVAA